MEVDRPFCEKFATVLVRFKAEDGWGIEERAGMFGNVCVYIFNQLDPK